MATIQTNRGLLTANTPEEVQRLVDAGLIDDVQASRLLATIASGTEQAPSRGSLQAQADATAAGEVGFSSALSQLRESAQAATSGAPAGQVAPTAPPAQAGQAFSGRDPRIEFLERRGVGPGGIAAQSRAGQFIGSQFDPLQQLFNLQQVIGAAAGSDIGAQTIGEFTPQFPDRASRSVRGSQILSQFFGLSPTQRADFGLNFDPAFDEQGQDISGGLGLGFLQDLLTQGTRGSRGARGSSFISSRVPAVQQAFQLEQPGGDFVPFLRERLGLAGL